MLFYLFLLGLISLGLFFFGSKIESEKIILAIEKTGFWAPLVFIVIMFLTYVVAPVSGTPVLLAGYILFQNKIQIYGYFAFLMAATVNFCIARIWGRNLVSRLVGKENIKKIDQFTQDYGIKSLIFLRLFQIQFHDFISYAYGLTNMKFTPYFIISALSLIPWLFLWQFFIFERVNNIKDYIIFSAISLIPLWIISAIFILQYKRKKKHGEN